MKVCFLYHSFFRHGGIQRVVAQVVNHLCGLYDVELICCDVIDIDNNPYHIDLDKVTVKYLPIFQSNKLSIDYTRIINILNRKILKGRFSFVQQYLGKLYYHKNTKQLLIQYLNQTNCQIIIGCSMPFNTLLGSISSKVSCKVWGWEHNEYNSYFGKRSYLRYQKSMYSIMLKNLDQFIVLTKSDASLYEKTFGMHTTVIPNALGFSSSLHTDYIQKIILSIGRLDKDKQFDMLIDIFQKFLITHPGWQLRIIGEGNESDFLKQKVVDARLESAIHIMPYTEQIQAEYAQASIYVSTSKYESFGLTVLEAMACGLPIITFATTGPRSLVTQGLNGYIVPKYDKEIFLRYLNKLADDYAERISFGQKSCILACPYTWENIETQWLHLFPK